MDNIRNFVNQIRFNKTKQEDDMENSLPQMTWGNTVYKKDFTNISLTTVVYDAMCHLVSEGATIVHDANVIQGIGSTTIEVWYGCHEIMEDPRDGSPVSPENL